MPFSSVQYTLSECRKMGRRAEKVERWISYGKKAEGKGTRRDLFQFIDIIAIDPRLGIVAIQACTSDRGGHRDNILTNADAKAWHEVGGIIELWYWRKLKIKRGGKRQKWAVDIETIDTTMFDLERD